MASACVKNIGISPENIMDYPTAFPPYGWLNTQNSFSREFPDDELSKVGGGRASAEKPADRSEDLDLNLEVSAKDVFDFEFRLEDPVKMLPADELFSDGKLVPTQLSMSRPAETSKMASSVNRSSDTAKSYRRTQIYTTDPFSFSPKAPRCSSRLKELLGLKKLYQNNNAKKENHKPTSSVSSYSSNATKSLKYFLNRSSKSSNSAVDSSLSIPLLKDSDNESVSISSRLSLSSSSSSGHDHDDLPKLLLDFEKSSLNHNPICLSQNPKSNPPRARLVKPRVLSSENHSATRMVRSPVRRATDSTTVTVQNVSIDSPRMNSSGKIVFHSLERSSSSPSSFNVGPRFKHRGVERCYSANVRGTPVCSLRGSLKSGIFGFPLFSTPHRR